MFVVVSLIFLFMGRKIGWGVSKLLLYKSPAYFSVGACLFWGLMTAFAVEGLIMWLHPGPVLKWIFGYLLGCYVSIPNLGLLQESSIPTHAQNRHTLISLLPMFTYILFTALFALGIASLIHK